MSTVLIIVGVLCLLGAFFTLTSNWSSGSLLVTAFVCWIGAAIIDVLEDIKKALVKKP